jgi:hypothetical protein
MERLCSSAYTSPLLFNMDPYVDIEVGVVWIPRLFNNHGYLRRWRLSLVWQTTCSPKIHQQIYSTVYYTEYFHLVAPRQTAFKNSGLRYEYFPAQSNA